MRESVTEEFRVVLTDLLSGLESLMNKGGATCVPAAAVIRSARVVSTNIGPKGSVAGSVSPR